eukprot:3744071-Alexandrium_andersonii.AAC.1
MCIRDSPSAADPARRLARRGARGAGNSASTALTLHARLGGRKDCAAPAPPPLPVAAGPAGPALRP